MYGSNGSRSKDKIAEQLFSFSWTVEKINELKPRVQIQSPNYISGKYHWRLVMFPRGRPMHAEDIAIFLELVNVDRTISCCCNFEITIVNHKDKAESFKKATTHTFCQNQKDRGWDSFTDSQCVKLYDLEAGYLVPPKCTDLEIRCEIRCISSKREMEYVGLKNQGATCYLNSFLQALYHLPCLRREVYNMRTDDDLGNISIPLALQRVFFRLQTEDDAVDTEELTRSFGWSTSDTFRQHDVQELSRKLLEHLEEKMKKTPSQGILAKLFRGKFYNYVKCIKVEYESVRVDEYYDISLNVRGCKTLNLSFKKYCEVETMDGDNKYNAGDHGLQAAKKGIKFESFPPIMFLHLKRFEYDMDKNRYVKVNDRLVFPPILKLEEFLSPTADKSIKQTFHLHGVLVHSGSSVSSGHYYSFIKPSKDPQWYKFDDTRVTKASDHQAIDSNFGGFDEDRAKYSSKQSFSKTANAYMLLYLRESEMDTLLAPIRDHEIPKNLVELFLTMTEKKNEQKRLKEEEKLAIKIYISTEMHFYQHFGPDLVLPHNAMCFTVKQTDPISSLKTLLQPILGVPPHRLRIWNFVRRKNQTVRPDDLMSDDKPINSVYSFSTSRTSNQLPYIFFAEISDVGIDDDVKEPDIEYFPKAREMRLLYIKYYQPETAQIRYIGKVYLTSSTILYEIVPHLRMMAGLKDNVPLVVYEEIKKDRQDKINLYHNLEKAELQDGDILIIQEKTSVVYDFPYPKIPDYFSYLCLMKMVCFKPLDSQGKKDPTFKVEFKVEEATYQDVRESMAKHLKVPPCNIFVKGKQWKPRLVGDSDDKTLLKDMIQVITGENTTWDMDLRYEVHDFSVEKLPDLMMFNLKWRDSRTEPASTDYKVYVEKKNPKASKVILLFLEKCKVEPKEAIPEYRILAIKDRKIVEVYLASDNIPNGPLESHDYFVEEIPEDEKSYISTQYPLWGKSGNVGGDDCLIQCLHFYYGYSITRGTYIGDPFFFVVKKGESVLVFIERLRIKLDLEKKDMKSWKYFKIKPETTTTREKTKIIDDSASNLLSILTSKKGPTYFGMEHYNTIDRKPKNHDSYHQRNTEQGVKFYEVDTKKDK